MSDDRDAVLLAQDLLGLLGPDALFEASARVDACRREGDQQGVRFWTHVAHSMRLIAAFESRAHGDPQASAEVSALWRLMQRIEEYRHRAAQAELRAGAVDPAVRQDLTDIAREWRDLAAHVELLAKDHAKPG